MGLLEKIYPGEVGSSWREKEEKRTDRKGKMRGSKKGSEIAGKSEKKYYIYIM